MYIWLSLRVTGRSREFAIRELSFPDYFRAANSLQQSSLLTVDHLIQASKLIAGNFLFTYKELQKLEVYVICFYQFSIVIDFISIKYY